MNSVLFWSSRALCAVATDHSLGENDEIARLEQGGPTFTSRALAMVHAAIYDANNLFDGTTKRKYLTYLPVGKASSVDYAICGAAYTILLALYPAQRRQFNDAFDEFVTDFGPCEPASYKLGQKIALALFANRVEDGAETNRTPQPFPQAYPNSHSEEGYRSGLLRGMHRLDPLHTRQGFYAPTWGKVRPFVVPDILEFRAVPPPALTSNDYKKDFKEVREVGALLSDCRTDEETEIGIFWSYDGSNKLGTPPRLYNQIAHHIAADQEFTRTESARFLALINLALADAGIASWDSKYFYNLWRPIVGIRDSAEEAWQPLGAPASNTMMGGDFTPNFPSYTSGHATFGSAAMEIMRMFLKQKAKQEKKSAHEYTVENFVSDELNGETTDSNGEVRAKVFRCFTFDKGIQENYESRIYLGIHWRFDGIEGVRIGKNIAEAVFPRL